MHKDLLNKRSASRFLLLALAAVLALTALVAGASPQAGAGDGIDGVSQRLPQGIRAQSYVVLMGLAPAAVYDGSVNGLAATKADAGEKFDASTEAVKEHAAFSRTMQDTALKGANVSQTAVTNRYTTALNGFSAIMTPAQAEAMARQPGVVKVMKDAWRQPMADNTRSILGLDGEDILWDTGMDGEGVIVGVIDSGIWPEHPSFADDGSYAPPGLVLDDSQYSACDFGNTAHNPNDAPFTCNNKLIGARQMLTSYRTLIGAEPEEYDSARDDNGHGTHTASTSAGNANVAASIFGIDRGNVSGVAPRAYVIAYKALGDLGGFSSDLAAAIDQAVADGVDVINYSIGGGASLTGSDDIAFLYAADAGVHVATSAGNAGPDAATIGGPASVPWLTSVGANTQNRFFKGDVILGDGRVFTGASVTPGVDERELVDAAVAGGDLCYPGTLDPAMVAGKIVLCRRGEIARMDKSRAVEMAGGAGMILYENSDAGDLMADNHWVPSAHMDNTPGLQVKAYIAGQPYANNIYVPVASGDGTGDAAAGTPANTILPTAQIVGLGTTDFNYAPSMTSFSSRGPDPVAEDIIKPDITAPGIQILAGNSPTPIGGYPGELFQAIAGTSMSSPHIAGVFALMKQAHPDWSPAAVKSAIMTSSSQDVVDNDRVTPATPFGMGAGQVNPSHHSVAGSPFQPGLVYDAGFNDYLGFLCDMDPSVFGDPDATCAGLAGAGIPTTASNLNLASIGIADLAGTETVIRTVTSMANTADPIDYSVSVDAPPGYMVEVSPSSFSIAAGEEVTFEVTISNASAPVNECRFGSLTWTDSEGMYSVYSPIAVKASLIGVPSKLEGAGADGSGSFDVAFGYSGAYTAAAHGLVPAIVTRDNVLQDPDQEFDPADGYSNAHKFVVEDAAFLRFTLPPDAVSNPTEIDLDIFLLDPNGEEVASSTNGGTDEQIDVTLPENGTWTLYVHGWQTAGPSADYALYTWIIPAAPGGNLNIDAAPDMAELATTGNVEYSWTGAPAEWNLGAISHTGTVGEEDAVLLGLTLIDVDNRP